MKTKSHFSFNGNAQEALNFYTKALNGTVANLARYGEYTEMPSPEDYKGKIMHSDINFNDCTISIADAMPGEKSDFGKLGHTLTLFCDTDAQIKELYRNLSEGGEIRCELCQPPYAKQYAEVIDKFGILWALIIE